MRPEKEETGLTNQEILINIAKIITQLAYKNCVCCSKRKECWNSLDNVSTTIGNIMKCFEEYRDDITSEATIGLLRIIKEKQNLKKLRE